jgi:hypothetical protein
LSEKRLRKIVNKAIKSHKFFFEEGLSLCGHVWVCADMFRHVWACLGMLGHAWACTGMCGNVWECFGIRGRAQACACGLVVCLPGKLLAQKAPQIVCFSDNAILQKMNSIEIKNKFQHKSMGKLEWDFFF